MSRETLERCSPKVLLLLLRWFYQNLPSGEFRHVDLASAQFLGSSAHRVNSVVLRGSKGEDPS
jgi:hypothetical protein